MNLYLINLSLGEHADKIRILYIMCTLLTLSTAWLYGRLMSGLLLTHIDGKTGLNTPGECEQTL